jgi:hypothetical protein
MRRGWQKNTTGRQHGRLILDFNKTPLFILYKYIVPYLCALKIRVEQYLPESIYYVSQGMFVYIIDL